MKKIEVEKLLKFLGGCSGIGSKDDGSFLLVLKYGNEHLLCYQTSGKQTIRGTGSFFGSVIKIRKVVALKNETAKYYLAVVLSVVVENVEKIIPVIIGAGNYDSGISYFAIADEPKGKVLTFSFVESVNGNNFSRAFCYKQDMEKVLECQHRMIVALLGVENFDLKMLPEDKIIDGGDSQHESMA